MDHRRPKDNSELAGVVFEPCRKPWRRRLNPYQKKKPPAVSRRGLFLNSLSRDQTIRDRSCDGCGTDPSRRFGRRTCGHPAACVPLARKTPVKPSEAVWSFWYTMSTPSAVWESNVPLSTRTDVPHRPVVVADARTGILAPKMRVPSRVHNVALAAALYFSAR